MVATEAVRFLTFFPMLISIVLVIYVIILFSRFVRAVEKIADKFESK